VSRIQPADLLFSTEPLGRRAVRFALILAAHLAVLWGTLELASRPEVRQAAAEVLVRLVEPPRAEPKVEPPRPEPPAQRVQPTRSAPLPETPLPLPVLAAPADAPAPAETFAVPPQPPAPPALPPIEAAPPPPAPVTAARFDADYLANPKPVYPVASRRLGEEGKVVLRVKVSHGGTPMVLEIKQSSGFPRLDEAARSAVEHWRFVPARRGDEAVESWVSVPIVFSLQAS
jgi:periplasmic protein TonB